MLDLDWFDVVQIHIHLAVVKKRGVQVARKRQKQRVALHFEDELPCRTIIYVLVFSLQDVYNSLSNAGFSHQQIEQAMSNTVPYGGDLLDALDWLCLNIANGKYM